MNVTIYNSLINNPDTINDIQSISLERIVMDFPYFQSARALYLKGLYNQNSFKYNSVLKTTATHTTDRSVLFEFITSDTFKIVNKEIYNKKIAEVLDINVSESEFVENKTETKLEVKNNSIEESILTTIKNVEPVIEDEPVSENEILEIPKTEEIVFENKIEEENISENLELGKPLDFTKNEMHSFQEWLQLSKMQPIQREETNIEEKKNAEENLEQQKKNELIDRFIEANPKIPPVKPNTPLPSVFAEPSDSDHSSLMTETLARVYLEQKKYQKAIQAYEILILKYPEKISFFANRISDIKKLQQNNN